MPFIFIPRIYSPATFSKAHAMFFARFVCCKIRLFLKTNKTWQQTFTYLEINYGMKRIFVTLFSFIAMMVAGQAQTTTKADSLLRHVVLFKFKDGTSAADLKKVEDAFRALPSKIPEIKALEWGTNNSPEG